MIASKDKTILRELAKAYAELAAKDINQKRIRLIRDMHSLKEIRPLVWIDEIPWHEMDIDDMLTPRCESKEAQKIENFFRRVLFRWKYIQADMVVEDAFYIRKVYTDSGIGVNIKEETASNDNANTIVSHHYEDQLDTEEKVDALKLPIIQAHPETDRKNIEIVSEIFDGIIPVKLRGHEMFYAPWDDIGQMRGVEACLFDMIDNPILIHKTIKKFTDILVSKYTQMDDQGLMDFNIPSLHCTPPYTDDLPAKDYDGGRVRLKDIWFRGMAQLFSSASPAMHEEFDLQYMRPFMETCGLSYYGCCEPLDKIIPYLKKIPNLRKIGVSPWADVRSCAEQVGRDYVIARKPNPAHVSGVLNTETVKKEITETVEACIGNKCSYEFVLKDISTVGYKPQNLIEWVKITMDVINRYYS
jgi:hypothetical protein